MGKEVFSQRHIESIPTFVTRELATYFAQHPELAMNLQFNKAILEEITRQRTTCQKNWDEDPKVAMEIILKAIDRFQKSSKRTKRSSVSCRRGCSFCCHINVRMSSAEAQILSDYCARHGIKISRSYLQAQLEVAEGDFAGSPASRCIFLKNNECQVYAARPIACRRYFVESDPKYCNVKQYPDSPNVRAVSDLGLEVFLSAILPVMESQSGRMPAMLLPYST